MDGWILRPQKSSETREGHLPGTFVSFLYRVGGPAVTDSFISLPFKQLVAGTTSAVSTKWSVTYTIPFNNWPSDFFYVLDFSTVW
jgi:hypothetical protein